MEASRSTTSKRPSVCVIGCGPSGMFFCHAVERRIAKMTEGDEKDLDITIPDVTVFERASSPGGVWRSDRSFSNGEKTSLSSTTGNGHASLQNGATNDASEKVTSSKNVSKSTQMYEALWINACKENIEFFDYTFDEHFGHAIPTYLPREAILDYLNARVTRKCPDFFQKYVQFNTSVQYVEWLPESKQFSVKVTSACTNKTTTHFFDYCIWAAGDNGYQKIPKSLKQKTLSKFSGPILHSSDTANFYQHVHGKRVCFVGGNYSAEDLALMAIKLGVSMVYIVSRRDMGMVSAKQKWPENKVKVYLNYVIAGVRDGHTLELSEVEVEYPMKFVPSGEVDRVVKNIDTIILCTGYNYDFSMFSPHLTELCYGEPYTDPIEELPTNWTMEPNSFTKYVGDVKFGVVDEYPTYHAQGFYRAMIPYEYPQLMFCNGDFDSPLLALDICCTWFANIIMGVIALPTPEEMKQDTDLGISQSLHYPFIRYYADSAYREVVDNLGEDVEKEMYNIWEEEEWLVIDYSYRLLAELAQLAKYEVDLGTIHELSEIGKKMFDLTRRSSRHRELATQELTFRDATDSHEIVSHFTGTPAVPLKKKWMDIDETVETVKDILSPE